MVTDRARNDRLAAILEALLREKAATPGHCCTFATPARASKVAAVGREGQNGVRRGKTGWEGGGSGTAILLRGGESGTNGMCQILSPHFAASLHTFSPQNCETATKLAQVPL